jgi:phenylacetate-coenzyme A ligase PaaK-like adenylate-forming protein
MAVGCWQGRGMHLNEDLVIVEPVDEHGRPVAAGAVAAKVLVTNLFNPTLPLIRYELTDEAVLIEEPCPCGSAYRRVDDIAGRADDLFAYPAAPVHPHVVRSVLGRHREVAEYQVHQTADGIELLVTSDVDHAALVDQLASALARAGLPEPVVSIRRVDRLVRHERTGKLARFVPMAMGRSPA